MLTQIRRLRSFSAVGLLRFVAMKLRGRSILVAGSCRGCGSCCRQLSLEGNEGWLRSESSFAKIVAKYPEYDRFTITGKDSQGFLLFTCSWLTADGSCIDHQRRLALCRNFPESSLLFCGGKLPAGCGYRFKAVIPFEKILARELRKK